MNLRGTDLHLTVQDNPPSKGPNMTTRHRLLAFLTIAVGAAAASASAGEQTGVQASSAESFPPPTGTGVPAFAQAQWVAPPADRETGKPLPLFRKEFRFAAQPRRAMLRIVGLGDYDPRVNGVRLAHTGINQPWSQYEKTTYYRDFDITALVRAGDNCVGVMLANSFWNNPNPPQGAAPRTGHSGRRKNRSCCAPRSRWSTRTARWLAWGRTQHGGRGMGRLTSRTQFQKPDGV